MQFNATGRHKRKKMSDSSRLLLSALCFISIGVSSHNLYRWPVLYLMWTWISFDTTHSSQMATILNDFEWKCESNLYSLLFEILVIKGRKSPTQSVRSQDALKQTMQIVLRRLRLLLLLEMGGLATTRATQRKKKQTKQPKLIQCCSRQRFSEISISIRYLWTDFFRVNLNRSIHSDVEK